MRIILNKGRAFWGICGGCYDFKTSHSHNRNVIVTPKPAPVLSCDDVTI